MTATTVAKTFTFFALIALIVAGCGRKGDLEVPPPRPSVDAPADAKADEEPEEDRPFFLDRLIQ
ncbi:MAG: lipoprotein [Pseudomonadota bacterium]